MIIISSVLLGTAFILFIDWLLVYFIDKYSRGDKK